VRRALVTGPGQRGPRRLPGAAAVAPAARLPGAPANRSQVRVGVLTGAAGANGAPPCGYGSPGSPGGRRLVGFVLSHQPTPNLGGVSSKLAVRAHVWVTVETQRAYVATSFIGAVGVFGRRGGGPEEPRRNRCRRHPGAAGASADAGCFFCFLLVVITGVSIGGSRRYPGGI